MIAHAHSIDINLLHWQHPRIGHPFCDLCLLKDGISQEVAEEYFGIWSACESTESTKKGYDLVCRLGLYLKTYFSLGILEQCIYPLESSVSVECARAMMEWLRERASLLGHISRRRQMERGSSTRASCSRNGLRARLRRRFYV